MKLLDIKEIQKLQLELMKELHNFLQEKNIQYYLIAGSALGAVRHKGFIPWDDDIDIAIYREDYEKFINLAKDFNTRYEVVNFSNKNNCDFLLTRIYIPNTYIKLSSIEKTKLDKRLYLDIFPLDNVPEDETERIKYENKIRKKKALISRIDARDYGTGKLQLLVKKTISFFLKPFRKSILSSTDRLLKKYRHIDTSLTCSLCSQYSFEKQVMLKDIYGEPSLIKFEDTEFYAPMKLNDYLTKLYGEDYMQVPPIEKRRKSMVVYSLEEE